jgi:hypothetical protein
MDGNGSDQEAYSDFDEVEEQQREREEFGSNTSDEEESVTTAA